MGRKQKLENALRLCIDCLNESILYFVPGKYPLSLPSVLNNANRLLGQLNTTCGSCESFQNCIKESGEILNSGNEYFADELRGTPSCKDYKPRKCDRAPEIGFNCIDFTSTSGIDGLCGRDLSCKGGQKNAWNS